MVILICLLILFAISCIFPFFRDFYKSLWLCFKTPFDPFTEFHSMIGFAGHYGQGKSLQMSQTILNYQKLAKKKNKELKVYTNYHFNGQTGQLNSLNDLEDICNKKRLENDDSYVLFAIDELQNCLNSRNWNDTKKLESLLPIFTMTRKLRVMLLYTTPVSSMADKNIRISSKSIYLCKKINRFFFVRWRVAPIELEGDLKQIKLSLFPTKHCLLNDEVKNSYNSFAFIETLQKYDYKRHDEVNDNAIVVNNFNRIKAVKKK